MKNKKILLIGAIIVILGAYLLIDNYMEKKDNTRLAEQAIFPVSFSANNVSKLEIVKDSQSIIFARSDSSWILNGKYTADSNIVARIISAPLSFEKKETVSKNPESFTSYAIDDINGIKVRFFRSDDTEIVSFWVGNMGLARDSNYLRTAGSDNVWLVQPSNRLDLMGDTNSFRDHSIVSVGQDFLTEIQMASSAKGKVSLYNTNEKWNVSGIDDAALDSAKVDALLNILSRLSANNFVDSGQPKEFGLDPAVLEVSLINADGVYKKILFGSDDGKGNTYVKLSDMNQIYSLSTALFETEIFLKVDDFRLPKE